MLNDKVTIDMLYISKNTCSVAAFSQKFNNIRALGIQSSISCSMHCVNFLSVVFWVAGFIFIVCKEIGGAIG